MQISEWMQCYIWDLFSVKPLIFLFQKVSVKLKGLFMILKYSEILFISLKPVQSALLLHVGVVSDRR